MFHSACQHAGSLSESFLLEMRTKCACQVTQTCHKTPPFRQSPLCNSDLTQDHQPSSIEIIGWFCFCLTERTLKKKKRRRSLSCLTFLLDMKPVKTPAQSDVDQDESGIDNTMQCPKEGFIIWSCSSIKQLMIKQAVSRLCDIVPLKQFCRENDQTMAALMLRPEPQPKFPWTQSFLMLPWDGNPTALVTS